MALSTGDRVQVVNQMLDTWGMFGTVKLVDRHGSIWVRLDGYGTTQFLSFAPADLAGGKNASPLVYAGEPTTNQYYGATGPVS